MTNVIILRNSVSTFYNEVIDSRHKYVLIPVETKEKKRIINNQDQPGL